MGGNRGRQKRALEKKKRREARRTERKGTHGSKAPPAPAAGYDAERGPEARAWLELSEGERIDEVEAYHERALPPVRRPPSARAHAALHVVVETQLASGSPPEAQQALSRLTRDGMSRHDAIHAIAFVLSEHMRRVVQEHESFDLGAYGAELGGLTEATWREKAGLES
jgi:hypothetical protein